MENPRDRKYTKEHEWIRPEGESARVGITDYAQHSLTDIVFVELPEKGKIVEQFKRLAVLESVKSVSDVFSPASGEVTDANSELAGAPEKINQSPFEGGWIAKIRLKDPKELDALMSAEQYDEYLKGQKH